MFTAVACVAVGSMLARRRVQVRSVAGVALAVQFVACVKDPRSLLPTNQDRAAGDGLLETIRRIPGAVYVMDDPYLALRAGKQPAAGGMTLGDLEYSGLQPPSHLIGRLERGEFTALITRFDASQLRYQQPTARAIRRGYPLRPMLLEYPSERVFLPVAGGRYKPRWVFTRPSLGAS
jgi:hypothetical protein